MSVIETICLVMFSSGMLLFGLASLFASIKVFQRHVQQEVEKEMLAELVRWENEVKDHANEKMTDIAMRNQATIDAVRLRLNKLEERIY